MQSTGGIKYYDLDNLYQEAVERNFRGEGNTVGNVISQATYALVWASFTKWCSSQMDQQRAVIMQNFGTIGYQPIRENKRIAYIKLDPGFLAQHKLSYHASMEEVESQCNVVVSPSTRPEYPVMAKSAGLEKGAFHQSLLNILALLGELLSQGKNVEIDLQEFGKFQGMNGQIMYAPFNKLKPMGSAGKQTVKNLMQSPALKQPRAGTLPPMQGMQTIDMTDSQHQQFVQYQASFAYSQNAQGAGLSAMLQKPGGKISTFSSTMNDSPSRRFMKPKNEGKISAVLLGAGDDPMSKQQDYSQFAKDPASLMNMNFKKPQKQAARFPPVIDPFSRTLAAPVSAQRHYLQVCHRIGTNYTPTAKGFYIDTDVRTAKYKDVNDSGCRLDIITDNEVEPADEAEEYESIMHPTNCDPRRIQARRESYARYRSYVEREISVDVIAPIRQYWLTHIIELIPGDLHYVEKERIEYMIDTMLNEINKDYFDSVRKSILDYILRDENEMRRLGIQQVLDQPITWGDDFYKGIEPDEEWKHNVMMARMLMSENLCICSQATLELMRIWREKNYYTDLLCKLPEAGDDPVSLAEFNSMQKRQAEKIKSVLTQEWCKNAGDILREELDNLDKDQTKNFCDSVSTLMSNQVRDMAERSINKYVEFFQRFKKTDGQKYPSPEEVIARQYEPDAEFELTFLTLKLIKDSNGISFDVDIYQVQQNLINIVLQMIEKINSIPRPDLGFRNPEQTSLWDIITEDELVQNAMIEIKVILSEHLGVTQRVVNVYDEYRFLITEKEHLQEFLEKKPYNRDEFLDRINRYQDNIDKIKSMPFEIRMSMFLIQCEDLNNKLINECEELIRMMLSRVGDYVQQDLAQKVQHEVRAIKQQFSEKVTTTKDLVEAETYLDKVKGKTSKEIVNHYNDMIDWLRFLYKYPQAFEEIHHEQNSEIARPVAQANVSVNMIGKMIDDQSQELEISKATIEKKLLDETRVFVQELEETLKEVESYKDIHGIRKNAEDQCKKIAAVQQRLLKLSEQKISINQQEEDLDQDATEFPQLPKVKKAIGPFQELWTLAFDIFCTIDQARPQSDTWTMMPICQLDPEDIESRYRKFKGKANTLKNQFEMAKIDGKSDNRPAVFAKQMYNACIQFEPWIRVIRAFNTKGIEQKHIDKLNAAIDKANDSEDSLNTLNLKMDIPIMSLGGVKITPATTEIEDIADTASKEYSNICLLKTMKEDWKPLNFDVKEHKDTFILEGEACEAITTLLDDHLIKTQTMKGSPYAAFMLEPILEWEGTLERTQDFLETWVSVQSTWRYLEPVFSSEDLMNQMRQHGTIFREVDREWKRLMAKVANDPSSAAIWEIDGLGPLLKACQVKLEEVTKGLNQYLESKQGLFPRFYFLSNEELLEILSETKEPTKVQPHIHKCMEGIHELIFDEDKKIHGMVSAEGEKVNFVRVIDPVAARGNVEEWLLQVEETMIKTVKQSTDMCLQDYGKRDREKWVIAGWPGMAIIGVDMMQWTQGSEEAMKKNGIAGLEMYYEKLQKHMEGLVHLVRTPITALQRCTIEAMIVLDVHAKEVIKTDLIDVNESSPQSFAWMQQLRYYWEDNDVWCKNIINTLDYNYEYLGNSARLVITPLTDRCYRTLCSAIALNYGGAPEGPAGTGKTETVKDLAKALARQCIVFNCSDQMDHLQMYKFFKGLSACGAWSCYDEFNRITRDVLSVIAAQLNMIQQAIEKKQNPFDFDGFLSPIKFTCNCFITMNPGYAGRAELPDNLKALFRTVAMMVPDYALIARISLFSFGFERAPALSFKITTTYTLCSEQLSTQKHYDYGMRAVKSVITAAGNLKRKYPNDNEDELVLRAINDVNLAKFLAFDLPLYTNITKDLFPGVVLPTPDYEALFECIRNQAKKKEYNLQCTDYFMVKIIQLYEMITVRHGLMVVGPPFAGKTSAIKILAAGMAELAEKGVEGWFKSIMQTVNPKSVTLAQLYGTFDEISGDWTDGILPVAYRTLATMDPKDRRWLIFDGPVDAIWIESMNTVLDDNRKLCLTNGEQILMGQNMTMMFEPMDLLVASPATVSRCGMVYMQPQELGWDPLFDSWKNTLPEFFLQEENQKFITAIDELVEVVVQPCLDYIRTGQVTEMTPTVDQNLFNGLLRNWTVALKVFEDENFIKEHDKKVLQQIVDSSFIYAAIWSLCCSIDTPSRKKFDQYFKKICEGQLEGFVKFQNKKVLPSLFDRGTIYDYVYFPKDNKWQNWNDLEDKTKIDKFPEGTIVQDIVVTTIDSIRYSYIMFNNIMDNIPTLFCGPTGTGKSAYIQNVLMNKLEKGKFMPIECGFSAQSKAQMVQGIVDLKLDAKRGKGKHGQRWGPKLGTRAVLFVDDLNMPKQEESLAMPPVEIVRQYMDQRGWYDLKDPKHPFRELVDLTVVSAMGPPGGGKSIITPRFQRHFNTIIFSLVDEGTMKTIFMSILSYFFREGKFVSDICNMNEKLVQATLNVYRKIQEDLKPTPAKSHYTFNLRDVSKVICGICLMDKKELTNPDTAVRLWAHESTRVFGDRLINEDDRKWMLSAVTDCVRAPFGSDFNTLFRHLDSNHDGKVDSIDEFRGCLFGDIYTPFQMRDRDYVEILDKDKLKLCANGALEQYNGNADKPMNLVLFNFAVEHLLRIGRIIRQPNGHALLVGVGGSGRQSLTRLASAIPDYDVFQVEIKKIYRMQEFREDIKNLMRGVGGKGQPTSFIFTDNSIKEEAFLEDINNILNTGEVPNIFTAEDKAEIIDLVRNPAKEEGRCLEGTPAQYFSYFIERCKKFLHIVLAFSPIGDALRKRILAFPSLVNCTSIDWFSEWPADALQNVAESFLADLEMDDTDRQNCVEMVQIFHTTTHKQSQKFLKELKRNYYVTPTSFLELISTFIQLLNDKKNQVTQQRDRYANGYKTLIETEKKVNEMSANLEELKPKLVIKAEEVAKQSVIVEKEAADAQVIADDVGKDAAVAKEAADKSDGIARDCKEALAEAMPALKAAEKALESITPKDITMIKSVQQPTVDTLMVMTTVCILMKIAPASKMNPETQKKEFDYWKPAQKMMNQSDFRSKLLEYPKEEITEDLIKKLDTYLQNPNYNRDKLVTVSSTIASFGDWVMAMHKFYFVNKIVIPKKAALAQAQSDYDVVAAELKIKQASLDEIMSKVNKLKRQLQDAKDELEDLNNQLEDCKSRLIKAESLIGSLSKEKERWDQLSKELSVDLVNLTGDVLIASGMIAYLGAFNSSYREELSAEWVKGSSERKIPNSGEFSLKRVLGNPVEIRQWNLQQLPSDDFSIENAIITKTARRWPLFIDPQGQANKWIRNLGKDDKIKVMKFTDGNYLKFLEGSIRYGTPVLIENVGTELDPAIEPLLQKQIYKKGSSYNIKIGDSIIEYSMNFKFYLTTKLRNPHYLPEVSTKVTLLNFMITYEGLSDQLLGIVVEKENPELQQKKEQLVVDAANNKKKLAEIEESILKTLQESDDILGDEAGINVLTNASVVSVEINKQQEIAAKTEIEIDEARIGYKPIAEITSGLFFCIQDLANINTMYQYSLPFFIHLFNMAIDDAEPSEDLEERIQFLNKEFLSSLYRNICRSLFEQDKPIFSMLLTFKLLDMKGELNQADLRFLITGGVSLGEELPECPAFWMSNQAWGEMIRACKLPSFSKLHGFLKHFTERCNDEYRELYEMPDPSEFKFPLEAERILTDFTKLIVIRIIKPDKLVPAMMKYVVDKIGEEFVSPPPFDLTAIYKDSSNITPLIFVLSPGSDPMKALEAIALQKKRNLKAVSIGRGQGVKAEAYIKEAVKSGDWVVLQNCHLAAGWLENLEKICEDLREDGADLTKVNRDFRLWLTSYPADDFPVSILQNGVKMTNEPPKGLRANIGNSFNVTPINSSEFFNGNSQPQKFKKLLFGILVFHAVIQERRLYGPMGWINKYEFNEPDLRISVKQLDIFLEQYPDAVPFDALHYCIGQCNYGGRVTDAKDRVLLEALLKTFFCNDSLDESYKYSPSGLYFAPPCEEPEEFRSYVASLPQFSKPEIFGMHDNAAITKEINETRETLFSILSTMQQSSGGGGDEMDKVATDLANSILEDVPDPFDVLNAEKLYPIQYNESMNTVLTQELERYNGLIKTIKRSLNDMKRAIKGEILMSEAVENAMISMCDGLIPDMWIKAGFNSLRPLGSYIKDVKIRLAFFDEWIEKGIPQVFWINKFFFTHGFLTGALQNYARKYSIAIDTLTFDQQVVHDVPEDGEGVSKPEDGLYCLGMQIEGARWNKRKRFMDESEPKILYTVAPMIHFVPSKKEDISLVDRFACPLFKTPDRRGVLMTTGHSTNYVTDIKVPTNVPASHWVKRGVAMLLSIAE